MDKATLRREFLQKRMNLTQNEIEGKSLLIAKRTCDFLKNKSFRNIHIFLPQRNKNEIDTWKITSAIQTLFHNTEIALPYIIPGTREMEHYILDTGTALIENRWGIPEPDPLTGKKILPVALDIIFIPLLIFDTLGYRVGYGGGYYDRFLAQCRSDTLKVGLSFFEPVSRIEDIDEFDIKMDASITPHEILIWH